MHSYLCLCRCAYPIREYSTGSAFYLTNSEYELLEDKRTVRMRGSRHVYTRETRGIYQIKLEAAKLAGYRAMYLGAHKDRKY